MTRKPATPNGDAVSRPSFSMTEGDFFRLLVEQLPDAITIADLEGRIIKTNRHGAALFGTDDPNELAGTVAFELIAPEDRERALANMELTLAKGRLENVEYTMLRKDGSRYPAELSASIIPDAEGQPMAFVATVRDVSKRKQIEARLAQADRLASLGMLAAGVAHEINNPLAYLLLNMTRVADDLPRLANAAAHCRSALDALGGEPGFEEKLAPCSKARLAELAKLARLAAEGGQRVKKIVNDLKSFARTDEDRLVPVQLNTMLDNAADIASPELSARTQFDKDYGELPLIRANEDRLCQVFLNLLLNAAHAVADCDENHSRIWLRTRAHEHEIEIEIADSGQGIEPEIMNHIFEPFFTTKPADLGSGMGLTICQNIVHAHGGVIEVESTPGKGSRFLVRLPIHPV